MGTVSAIFLAGVFAFAAVSKVRDLEGTRRGFSDLGLPRAKVLVWAVPAAEAAIAVLLVISPGWGGVAGFAMLLAFTVVLVLTIRSGRLVPCRCFGGTATKPVSWGDVARNVWLLCHAVLASLITVLAQPSMVEVVIAAATIAVGPIVVVYVENRFTVAA